MTEFEKMKRTCYREGKEEDLSGAGRLAGTGLLALRPGDKAGPFKDRRVGRCKGLCVDPREAARGGERKPSREK